MIFSAQAVKLALLSGMAGLGTVSPPVLAQRGIMNASKTPPTAPRDVASDTWVATDALGRSLPTHQDVGPPRAGKVVGIFYFLWLGQHGTQGPFDITKITAHAPNAINEPENSLWGPLYAPHHWGEPAFGYYLSDDEWVYRRHAQMLSDAGVDVVIFDVTNQLTYPRSYRTLCRVWSQMRREGAATPQIAFLAPFWQPARVVKALYDDFYKQNLYPELWFRWKGKPLIMADPQLLSPQALAQSERVPSELRRDGTLGQIFRASRPFTAVGGEFPTWNEASSGVTLSLYRLNAEGQLPGRLVARQRLQNVRDNARTLLELPRAFSPGTYYLEQSDPQGRIGWWSQRGGNDDEGRAYRDSEVAEERARSLAIRYAGEAAPTPLIETQNRPETASPVAVDSAQRRAILEFFTFRKPRPDYFGGPDGGKAGEWGWLDISPQKIYPQPDKPDGVEQMTVGVAQNALGGELSVLSNPLAHGRSFHDGRQPPPGEQDFSGRNFQEQWDFALKNDPEFIFVTGWNEWVAGRFPQNEQFHAMTPVSFVDSFNHEYSRDIEPVRGGHTDSYYYQLVANVRRFKGARPLPLAGPPRRLTMDGDFTKWRDVRPEYRDHRGETLPRDHAGWGNAGRYVNRSGRNEFDLLKVAHDADNLYFYGRTARPITSFRDPEWMLLCLDTDGDPATGWQGFDFIVNRQVLGATRSTLEKSSGGWNWKAVGEVQLRFGGNEMELAISRRALGLDSPTRPLRFDFKWMDNVGAEKDLLNLYTHGDTAPSGRFRYRYDTAPAVGKGKSPGNAS
ncbi:MAG: hypothetical protein KY445_12555 [Armatimonadetes bacterium]|nr:hypothetical protein [Armatimonadota bacterium]